MIKDGKDTEYNKLGYYPFYWVKVIGPGVFGYGLYRCTNTRDRAMCNENGKPITGTYDDLIKLADTLNEQNTGLKKRSN